MKDISISSSKIRGRPKGRSNNFITKWNDQIVYPEPMPYSHNHIYKLAMWKTSSYGRKLEASY